MNSSPTAAGTWGLSTCQSDRQYRDGHKCRHNDLLRYSIVLFRLSWWHITGYKNFSLYTEPELLVGVIPSGDVEADEAGQEGDDFMAGDF